MRLAAPKRTPQVLALGIARMAQEEDAAMPAAFQAGSPLRMGAQNRAQQTIILLDQISYR
jgi:hypothetical protein